MLPMRFATTRTIINPPFPVKQAGHLLQVTPITEVHDNLEARILYLENEHCCWIHISADNLQFEYTMQKSLEDKLRAYYGKPLHVTLSTTHSHHCADGENPEYFEYFKKTVLEAAMNLEIREEELYIHYQTALFEGTGKSRISHHQAETRLGLIEIRNQEKRLADITIYNVHPTVLYATTPYFSADYVGWYLHCCNENDPDVFHTWMSGPAGDTSTRFTRTSQDYSSVKMLGSLLFEQVQNMKDKPLAFVPMTLNYTETVLHLNHEMGPVDFSLMPQDLSERELETIEYGKIMREKLQDHPEQMRHDYLYSKVDLGAVRLIFAPNEMFSWWHTPLNREAAALVCYSNGWAHYLTGPDQHLITYETFTDTINRESKLKIADLFKKWGQ